MTSEDQTKIEPEEIEPENEAVASDRPITVNQPSEKHENRLSIEEANRFGTTKRPFTLSEKVIFSVLFVVFFFVANAIALSHMPENEQWLIPIVRRYSGFFGLEQNWTMFSRLRRANFHMLAVITFDDGSEKIYEYPRMNLMDQGEHFRFEKRRTLFYEYLPGRWGRKYRPSMIRHLIWCNDFPDKHPEVITVVYNFADVPQPDPQNWTSAAKLPLHRDKTPYFVYRVRPGDLVKYVERP